MTINKLLGCVAATALLAGCMGYDVNHIRSASPTGDEFSQGLYKEYLELTNFEADKMGDWQSASVFARKGLAAASGSAPAPEAIEDYSLPDEYVGEMTDARGRLTSLLEQTATQKAPGAAARAQGRFDCWIEQQEENHQPDDIAACRKAFYSALADLEVAMAPPEPAPSVESLVAAPTEYSVYFDFDSAALRSYVGSVLDNVLNAASDSGATGYSVTGYTDTAGSIEYNLGLSLKRANAVKDALVARGISPDAITVAGRGESNLAVDTPDNTPAQANRRAVVVLQ